MTADEALEVYLMQVVKGAPGEHRIKKPQNYLDATGRAIIRAIWRLWRRGDLRVDWRLRLWPS